MKPEAVLALGGPRHGQGHAASEWREARTASTLGSGRLDAYAAPVPYDPRVHGPAPLVFRGSGQARRGVPLDSEYDVLVSVWTGA